MSAPARPSTEPSAVTPDQPTGNRSIIAILLVGAFIVILNETTMNVALSQIMGDFGVTERVAQCQQQLVLEAAGVALVIDAVGDRIVARGDPQFALAAVVRHPRPVGGATGIEQQAQRQQACQCEAVRQT